MCLCCKLAVAISMPFKQWDAHVNASYSLEKAEELTPRCLAATGLPALSSMMIAGQYQFRMWMEGTSDSFRCTRYYVINVPFTKLLFFHSP